MASVIKKVGSKSWIQISDTEAVLVEEVNADKVVNLKKRLKEVQKRIKDLTQPKDVTND